MLCYYIVICGKTLQKPYISMENNFMKMLQLKRLKMNKLFLFDGLIKLVSSIIYRVWIQCEPAGQKSDP